MSSLTPAAAVAMFIAFVVLACSPTEQHNHSSEEAHEHEEQAAERGPHGGRLLRDGDFALELQIFEQGVPPEFHVYLYEDRKPLPPNSAHVSVELTRLGGKIDRFTFTPQGDHLRGGATVREPHSFSVKVQARRANSKTHQWTYDSFEGRTTIPADIARVAGIRTEIAEPAKIEDTLVLTGRLVPDAERMRTVSARFAGPIREVTRSVGDTVRAGERLATIESNESLQVYTVNAPIGGVITERHANPGETAGDTPLFVISDYRALWAELSLFPRDLPRVKAGQQVRVQAADSEVQGEGQIVRIAPAEGAQHGAISGVYTVRVAVDNQDGRWTPGLFVEGSVRIGEHSVPLAVKRSALQGFRDFTVVFAQVGDIYEVRMLKLGRQDGTWAEVLDGLDPGEHYVTENSYLIKADIEKAGASHDH